MLPSRLYFHPSAIPSMPLESELRDAQDSVARGQVIEEIDTEGNKVEYTYDDNNNVEKKIETLKPDNKTYTTTYKYDALNRLKSETNPEGNTAEFTYNTLGQMTGMVDFAGNTVSHDYDPATGWKRSTTKGSIKTSFTYYANGKLKTIADHFGQITSYAYDDQWRLDTVTYPDSTTKKYSYDVAGNVKTETQRDGTVITNTYDDANRLESRQIALSGVAGGVTSETYKYDAMNRIVEAINGDATVKRGYDKIGRLEYETQNGKTVRFGYNAVNNLTKITYSNGRVISRKFDALSRIEKVMEGNTAIAEMEYVGKMSRYLSKSYGNGDMVNYLYDLGKRMTGKTATNGGNTVINNYTYSYNAGGMKTAEIRNHAGGAKTAYEYDNVYRLTKIVKDKDTVNETSISVKLDEVDNILSMTTKKGADITKTEAVVSDSKLHQYSSFGDWGISYDQKGNMVRKATQQFEYDYKNNLIGYKDQGITASYKFDVFGRRVEKDVNGTVTKYVYAGEQVLEEFDGNTLAKQFIYGSGIDEVFNVKILTGNKAGDYYYHTDGIGSVTAVTNSTGEIVERVKYGIFGVPIILDKDGNEIAESLIGNTYLFHGRRFDKESNTYHYRRRSYDPTMGRFLQVDPLGYVDSMNLYQAFNMNGINYIDPIGKEWGPASVDLRTRSNLEKAVGQKKADQMMETYEQSKRACTLNFFMWTDGGDFVALGQSATDFIKKPSWSNLGWMGADAAGALLPIVPAATKVKAGLKMAEGAGELVSKAKNAGSKVKDVAKKTGRLIYDKTKKVWKSPAGLEYGFDRRHKNKINHVLGHITYNPDKPVQILFDTSKDKVLGLLDDAWNKRGAPKTEGVSDVYEIDMGNRVGTRGETKIRIVVKKDTSEVRSAYPIQ